MAFRYPDSSREPKEFVISPGYIQIRNIQLIEMTMRKERLILLVLAAIQFTNIMDFMIMMPLGPQLMRLFQISPRQFSLIVASYTISAGVSGFLSAFFIDRLDRKAALAVTYIGFTIGTLACALSPSYPVLLLARVLTGAFGGILSSLVLAIIADLIPFERRATAMGMVMTAFSVATVAGVPFGLFIASELTWHAPFYFLAGIGLIILLFIKLIIPPVKGHILGKELRGKPLEVITSIAGNPNQLKALFLMFLLMSGQFSVIPFISPYMVYNVGFTESQLPLIYLTGGICSIFTLPLIGRLADKFGKYRIFSIFVIASTVPFFLVTNLKAVPVWIALAVTALFFICMGGRSIPATTMITATVKPRNRGSFMSINSSVQQMSAGLASFIAGFIMLKAPDGSLLNYEYVGYLAILTSLISLFVAKQLRPVDNPEASETPAEFRKA
jgi:predicted MFS family arabinose efflux permease